jgi:hypothetical protein
MSTPKKIITSLPRASVNAQPEPRHDPVILSRDALFLRWVKRKHSKDSLNQFEKWVKDQKDSDETGLFRPAQPVRRIIS